MSLDTIMPRRRFLPLHPAPLSLYIFFLIVTAVVIVVMIMGSKFPEDGPRGFAVLGLSLLLVRAHTLALARVLWWFCRRLPGRGSEERAESIVMHNSAIFVLSLLLLVLERKLWPIHVGAQYLLSMWYPAYSLLRPYAHGGWIHQWGVRRVHERPDRVM